MENLDLPNLSHVVLSPKEQKQVEEILTQLASKGHSDAYKQLMGLYYEEIPVTIDKFIEDPDLVGNSTGNGKNIYPYWKKTLTKVLHGDKSYEEIILSGAIGLGKSTIAIIICAYLLYRLLCLKNPQEYYGLAPSTPIVFAFLNIHKYLASGVAYGQFQTLLQKSPWFRRHGQIVGTRNLSYVPDKNIQFVTGSNPEHIIGMNIYCAMMDEMSFAKKPNVDMLKSGIMDLYSSIKSRMTSRFTRNGILYAKMLMVSSKNTDSDFLDQYAQQQKTNPKTYIVDEPQWVVKPEGTFSKETFRLAVGGKNKKSVILAKDDMRTEAELIAEGYTQVIEPPETLREKFEFDMDRALKEQAGISTTIFTKFIAYDKLERCYTKKLKNPFENPEPIMGLDDGVQLYDYFNLDAVPEWITKLPLYIHCDIAYSGDGYGIGCVASAGTKLQYKVQTGEQVTDTVYIHVFSCKIKAHKGDQVSLEKVRQFIYWLKFTHDWNIKRVSYDGFNSADSIQQMRTRGIDADLISMDKAPCNGYLAFRTAVYEKRIAMIEIPMLEDELLNLERNEMTFKVDHPRDGSKDAADGLAGALYNASLHQEEYSPVSDSVNMFLDINDSAEEEETKQLREQLMNIVKKKEDPTSRVINEEDDMDQIMEKVTGNSSEKEKDGSLSEEERYMYSSQGMIVL